MASLSSQLRTKCIISRIDDKEFVPLDALEEIFNEDNVKAALAVKPTKISLGQRLLRRKDGLSKAEKTAVAKNIVQNAKKIFAILVLMDRVQDIYGLLKEHLTDDHLPLLPDEKFDNVTSFDDNIKFPFEGWTEHLKKEFLDEKQWRFVPQHIYGDGRLVQVNHKQALPFVSSDLKDSGAAGIVYRAKIHPKHQQGCEAETVDLEVAVKLFHHKGNLSRKFDFKEEESLNKKAYFLREHEILDKIKSLRNPHIVRHFMSIDKDDKGYIIFPWASHGDLRNYWEKPKEESSLERARWSMQQMLGITRGVQALHQLFHCRHGDLKPGNILCFEENGKLILKIADFGISKIHHAQTHERVGMTTTIGLTASYQAPEVEFEADIKEGGTPRSRKYDIWSLGCIFLEFSIWLLHGYQVLENFGTARGNGNQSTGSSNPLYEVTTDTTTGSITKAAKVRDLVYSTIQRLQHDVRCEGDSALVDLLTLIKESMLQPEIDSRLKAEDVVKELEIIVAKAGDSNIYLLHPSTGLEIPQLDFRRLRLDEKG